MITGDLTCMFAPVLVFTLGICCWWDLDNTGHLGQSASPPLSCQWKGTSSKSCDQLNKGENNGVLQLFIFFSQTSLHSLKYQAFSSSVNSSANAGTCCCNAHRMKKMSAASALLERQRESLYFWLAGPSSWPALPLRSRKSSRSDTYKQPFKEG